VTVEILDADENVMPGMTAAVNIVVSRKENVLLVPNRAIRYLNGQRTVYVLRDGKQQAVDVEIGSSSDTSSELISGDILPGEPIILNPNLEVPAQP
jgi:HlyD family secretion protein